MDSARQKILEIVKILLEKKSISEVKTPKCSMYLIVEIYTYQIIDNHI